MCYEYKSLFVPCATYLLNLHVRPTTPGCCAEFVHAFGEANNPVAIEKRCTCLFASIPILGFYHKKLILLPTTCKIKLSFLLLKSVQWVKVVIRLLKLLKPYIYNNWKHECLCMWKKNCV